MKKKGNKLFPVFLILSLVGALSAAPAFDRAAAVRAQDLPPTATSQPTETPVGRVQPIESPAVPVGSQPSTSASSSAPDPPRPAQSPSDQPPPTDQIIIKYKAGSQARALPMQAQENQRVSAAGGVPLQYLRSMSGDAHVLRLSAPLPAAQVEAIAAKLMALPDVEYAEADQILFPAVTPTDPMYGSQWDLFGMWGINAPAAWDITTGSSSIVVADIDTGITNHAEFSGRTVPGYDFINDPVVANDGNGRDTDPSDPGDWVTSAESGTPGTVLYGCPSTNSTWHGTHTAGTIGATSNNGIGVAGINWKSKILPVRVLGKCGGYTSDIADGISWAAGLPVVGVPNNSYPAKVLNLSLGGFSPCEIALQSAITAATSAGSVVVVAAGNANQNASYFEPANCSGVITVAATGYTGSKSSYSNWGSTVKISAPGGDGANGILSTLNTGQQGPVADTYASYEGTSMATPHVTGVVSLMFSVNPSLTPAQVLQILQSTARAYPDSTCTSCGGGVLDAGAAVAAAAADGSTAAHASTVGIYRGNTFYLRNSNSAGYADLAFSYGGPGDIPLAGDWDGNGTTTVGIYRNGTFYLRNSNTAGYADLAFAYGAPGDIPVVGDWDGNGTTTVGIYRNGTFYLRNSNTAGYADLTFSYGAPGDIPVVGDWDGNGTTTVGVFRNGVFYLRNSNTAGYADLGFSYGLATDIPVVGDWDGNGTTTVGIYRNGTFYLRNSNSAGYADLGFSYGISGDRPLAGDWDGLP